MEYILTTSHDVSTSVGPAFRETFMQALNGILNQWQRLAADVRPFSDVLLGNPVATATATGLLVLLVGLLLTRRG